MVTSPVNLLLPIMYVLPTLVSLLTRHVIVPCVPLLRLLFLYLLYFPIFTIFFLSSVFFVFYSS